LSHGPLCTPHGPVSCCVTFVIALDHGTFWQFNLLSHGSLSIPHGPVLLHDTCPMCMFQWSMGCLKCSTSFPWAPMHCPWSFLFLCHICPLGMVHWTMGHFDSSTCVPWATMHPPWSCPLLCHICPMGMLNWTMGHFDSSTCCPIGHYPSPMVLSCSMTPVPCTCCSGPWDV
jgi:hypothetical protein